jgi:site-specific DNA recombinase
MRAAIYCRVSTDDQEKEGTSLQTQREACLAYCKQEGYQVAKQFSETYSGLTLERPKLTELRNLIRANDLDIIVVYCLDRLSRDPYHGVILTQELEQHHATLEAVTETVESTEVGRLINYIRGFASKLEAEKIRERTMRGKQALVKQGKLPQGTGIGIYGYQWDKTTGKRTIVEHEAKIVQKIFTMASRGSSFNKIATELNNQGIKSKSGSLWYPLTIRRILNNPTYTGKTYYGMSKRVGKTKVVAQPQENWTLLPDITPPIITDEVFKQAQEAIKLAKQSRPVKPNAHYLLTSLVKCSKCGSPVIGTTLNGKYRYYHCRGAYPTATRGKICDAGYIRADNLENSIWHKLIEMLSSPLTLLRTLLDRDRQQPDKIVQALNKQINDLRKKIKAYPRKEKTLFELLPYENVTKDYVLDVVNKLKQERLDDERQLQLLLETRKEATSADHLTFRLSEASGRKFQQLVHDYDWNRTLYPFPPDGIPEDDVHEALLRKRSLFEAINLKVLADPTSFQFNFTLDGTIVSTTDASELASFEDQLEEFEKLHPDISVKDLLDKTKLLPETTPFAKNVNQLKQNLATIERTWA